MSKTPANDQPVPLFYGDKRLDSIYHAIKDEIYSRAGGQDIPIMSIIGILEKVKLDLIKEHFDD